MLLNGEPLAYRMRPTIIEEVVGQKDIIGSHTNLFKMLKNGYVPSMLLYGDPGIGKTSLAYAIAGTTKLPFISQSQKRRDIYPFLGAPQEVDSERRHNSAVASRLPSPRRLTLLDRPTRRGRPRAGRTLFNAERTSRAFSLDARLNSREFDADVTARFSEGLVGEPPARSSHGDHAARRRAGTGAGDSHGRPPPAVAVVRLVLRPRRRVVRPRRRLRGRLPPAAGCARRDAAPASIASSTASKTSRVDARPAARSRFRSAR